MVDADNFYVGYFCRIIYIIYGVFDLKGVGKIKINNSIIFHKLRILGQKSFQFRSEYSGIRVQI
ncbi:MAG: hypothetical protein D6746_09775 [Bacteroidetes bacterium]|nr:MAG: hypothetical protein D6746_09775 [Bacteroidota bacterium]